MMKKISRFKEILVVALAMFVVSCGAGGAGEGSSGSPRIVTDVENEDLRGAVKSVTGELNKSKVVFNEKGWKTEVYDSKLAVKRTLRPCTKFTYAEDGSTIIAIETIKYSWDDKATSTTQEVNITAEQRAAEELDEETAYQYNKDGYLTKSVKYNKRNLNKYINTYTYDGQNKLIESTAQILNITDLSALKGKDIEEIDLSSLNYDDVKMFNTIKYTYNEQGDAVSMQHIGEDGNEISTITNSYEYDSKGNWISKTTNLSAKQSSTYTREIEYFE